MSKTDLSRAEVLPSLPDLFRPATGQLVPDDIAGSVVVRIGGLPQGSRVEGGGLVIDYVPAGTTAERRVVFGFNELGMWVEFLQVR